MVRFLLFPGSGCSFAFSWVLALVAVVVFAPVLFLGCLFLVPCQVVFMLCALARSVVCFSFIGSLATPSINSHLKKKKSQIY